MRQRRNSTARHWTLALLATAASLGGGALIGSDTVSAMDPFYRYAAPERWRAPPLPGPGPAEAPPPIAYAPVRAPGFALPPVESYDDPALRLEPDTYREPAWTPPPLDFDTPEPDGSAPAERFEEAWSIGHAPANAGRSESSDAIEW